MKNFARYFWFSALATWLLLCIWELLILGVGRIPVVPLFITSVLVVALSLPAFFLSRYPAQLAQSSRKRTLVFLVALILTFLAAHYLFFSRANISQKLFGRWVMENGELTMDGVIILGLKWSIIFSFIGIVFYLTDRKNSSLGTIA